MKLILLTLLVAICSVQAKPSNVVHDLSLVQQKIPIAQRLNLQEYLENLIKQTVDNAVNALQHIQNGVNKIISKIVEALTDIEQQSEHTRKSILEYVNDQTKHLDWELIGQCIAEQEGAIRNITQEAEANINVCVQTATQALEQVHNDIAKQRDHIIEEIQYIYGVVRDCYNQTPTLWIQCVEDNNEGIVNSIGEIIEVAQEAIEIAAPQVVQIHQQAAVCLANAHAHAIVRIEVVVERIRECVLNNSQQ